MSRISMLLTNEVTGLTESRELPYIYNSARAAWQAVDFFQSIGGEWGDHDNADSDPIHVVYHVTPLSREELN